MADDDPEPALPNPTPEVIGAAAGAVIQTVLGDDYSGSVLAPAVASVIRLGRAHERAWWERSGRAVMAAADELRVEAQQLEQMAVSDPARTELFARVVQAAGRTPLEEKIPALGRVLARGLEPTTSVDEAFALAAALDDIEAPHVELLSLLESEPAGPSLAGRADDLVGWQVDELSTRLPGARAVLGPVLRTLDRHALTYDASAGSWLSIEGGHRTALTDFGRRCLALLRPA